MPLVGLTGTTHNNPTAGGGTTIINCKSIFDPRVVDAQRQPILDPCEAVITVNCPEPINRQTAQGILVTWGTDGGAQQLAIGNCGGSGTNGVNGPGRGTVFSPGICIPVKGSYFRLDVFPAPTGVTTPQLVASIAKGRCPPLILMSQTNVAGSAAVGSALQYSIPAFARRVRVVRGSSGIAGHNAFTCIVQQGTFNTSVAVVNGAEMDWLPLSTLGGTTSLGVILVQNDDPAVALTGVSVFWELSL